MTTLRQTRIEELRERLQAARAILDDADTTPFGKIPAALDKIATFLDEAIVRADWLAEPKEPENNG